MALRRIRGLAKCEREAGSIPQTDVTRSDWLYPTCPTHGAFGRASDAYCPLYGTQMPFHRRLPWRHLVPLVPPTALKT